MQGAASGLSVRPLDVTADPLAVVATFAEIGAVMLTGRWAGGGALIATDPIAVTNDPFGPLAVAGDGLESAGAATGAVGGGWFGWLAFDADRPGEATRGPIPAARWALYPNVLRFDARSGRWFDEALTGLVPDAELAGRRRTLAERLRTGPTPRPSPGIGPFTSRTTQAGYEAAVRECIEHIRAGDIYQANICLSLAAPVTGDDPAALYARLAGRVRPGFGACLRTADGAVVSASPELYLRRSGRDVMSSPIKGTRPRPADEVAATELAAQLRESAKDRAENVMIVDMVRNDLARVAATGSVRVTDLLRLERHPGVWHLVSDVTASLRDGATDADLVRASFPPGSVTGAPKHRALEIIAELEAEPRHTYTGAIGYRSPVAGLELSVAIRTLEIADGTARLGVGSGITASSQPREEWWECFDKAAPIVAAVGAELAVPVRRRT